MKRKFKGGMTSLSLPVVVYDNTSTTGAGLSGLDHATSGLVLEYRRAGQSTWTSVTLVSKTLGTYVSGGIVANGSRAGRYEVDIPDAAIAAGVRMVEICLRGAANMHPVDIEIELDAVDYQVDAFGAIKPTTAGRTLDVSAGGEAGIDFANIGSPTTTVNLTGVTIKTATDIETDTQDIQNRLPAALVDGRIVAQAQSVTDKNGYTLTQAFPANFNLLSITSAGAIASVINVLNVDELGAGALIANGAVDAIPPAVWNALTTETYVDGSFGDRSLISTNNTREVAVTGSHHVAAVLHDAEPNSIPEDAFVTGALSARALAADAATEIATAVAAPTAAAIADAVWDEILVGHLGAGTTGEALNNSGGSGNPWITDIATGYTGTQAGNVLNQVKAKTDLITSGTPTINVYPVSASTPERVAGTTITYYRNEIRSVSVVTDFTLTALTLQFVIEDSEGADLLTIPDGSISRSDKTFTVSIGTTVTATISNYRWALRDITGGSNSVIARGIFSVQEAAASA